MAPPKVCQSKGYISPEDLQGMTEGVSIVEEKLSLPPKVDIMEAILEAKEKTRKFFSDINRLSRAFSRREGELMLYSRSSECTKPAEEKARNILALWAAREFLNCGKGFFVDILPGWEFALAELRETDALCMQKEMSIAGDDASSDILLRLYSGIRSLLGKNCGDANYITANKALGIEDPNATLDGPVIWRMEAVATRSTKHDGIYGHVFKYSKLFTLAGVSADDNSFSKRLVGGEYEAVRISSLDPDSDVVRMTLDEPRGSAVPLPTSLKYSGLPSVVYAPDEPKDAKVYWDRTVGQYYLQLPSGHSGRVSVLVYNAMHVKLEKGLTPLSFTAGDVDISGLTKDDLAPSTRAIFELARKYGDKEIYGTYALSEVEQIEYAIYLLRRSWEGYDVTNKGLGTFSNVREKLGSLHTKVKKANCGLSNGEFYIAARLYGYNVRMANGLTRTKFPTAYSSAVGDKEVGLFLPPHAWVEYIDRTTGNYGVFDATPPLIKGGGRSLSLVIQNKVTRLENFTPQDFEMQKHIRRVEALYKELGAAPDPAKPAILSKIAEASEAIPAARFIDGRGYRGTAKTGQLIIDMEEMEIGEMNSSLNLPEFHVRVFRNNNGERGEYLGSIYFKDMDPRFIGHYADMIELYGVGPDEIADYFAGHGFTILKKEGNLGNSGWMHDPSPYYFTYFKPAEGLPLPKEEGPEEIIGEIDFDKPFAIIKLHSGGEIRVPDFRLNPIAGLPPLLHIDGSPVMAEEMTNTSFKKFWVSYTNDAPFAVYFSEKGINFMLEFDNPMLIPAMPGTDGNLYRFIWADASHTRLTAIAVEDVNALKMFQHMDGDLIEEPLRFAGAVFNMTDGKQAKTPEEEELIRKAFLSLIASPPIFLSSKFYQPLVPRELSHLLYILEEAKRLGFTDDEETVFNQYSSRRNFCEKNVDPPFHMTIACDTTIGVKEGFSSLLTSIVERMRSEPPARFMALTKGLNPEEEAIINRFLGKFSIASRTVSQTIPISSSLEIRSHSE